MHTIQMIDQLQQRAHIAQSKASHLKLSQESIAISCGLSQPQVSRVLSGRSKRAGKSFESVCKYIDYRYALSSGEVPVTEELKQAIAQTWDGTEEHARALATVIRSLGVFARSKSTGGVC